MDETAQVHEVSIRPPRNTLDAGGVLFFTWIIPGAAFVLLVFAAHLRFLAALPEKTAVLFLAAGIRYTSGALGMEMLGGYHADVYGQQNL